MAIARGDEVRGGELVEKSGAMPSAKQEGRPRVGQTRRVRQKRVSQRERYCRVSMSGPRRPMEEGRKGEERAKLGMADDRSRLLPTSLQTLKRVL